MDVNTNRPRPALVVVVVVVVVPVEAVATRVAPRTAARNPIAARAAAVVVVVVVAANIDRRGESDATMFTTPLEVSSLFLTLSLSVCLPLSGVGCRVSHAIASDADALELDRADAERRKGVPRRSVGSEGTGLVSSVRRVILDGATTAGAFAIQNPSSIFIRRVSVSVSVSAREEGCRR